MRWLSAAVLSLLLPGFPAAEAAAQASDAGPADVSPGPPTPSTAGQASAASRPHATPASQPSGEPSVRDVVRMALRAARSDGPARARGLARRARLSGLVPEVRVGADRGQQQDLSSSFGTATERQSTAEGNAIKLQASLLFELPRLVFAPEEVRILSVERWLKGDLQKVIEQVVRLYFQRQRLLRSLADPEVDRVATELAVAESEALLDTLTDDAFSAAFSPAHE